MKIILALNTLGSFVSHRKGLYLKLALEHRVKVILFSTEDLEAARAEIPAESLLDVRVTRKGVKPWQELRGLRDFYSHYRREKPDLVHHFTIKPVIYGTLAARLAGVPKIINSITGLGFVFTAKSKKALILKFLVTNLYRFCFSSSRVRVIFQNQDDRDFFIEEGIIGSDRCFLVPGSGVDVQKFSPTTHSAPPQTAQATSEIQPTQIPRIFLAARLLKEKGIFEFMTALSLLKQKSIKFEAWIAGDIDPGNPGSITSAQLAKWKHEGLAQFLGYQKDMVTLLKQIDIACLPSYREGLPMSLLEAMAAGKPVVTTDAPGCRATVPSGKNGILVPVGESEPLALALERLLSDSNLRKTMGEESRRLAEDEFSRERINSELLKVYGS